MQAQAALQAQAGRYAAALAQLERVTAERDKAVAENVGLRKKARLAEMSRDEPRLAVIGRPAKEARRRCWTGLPC